MALNGNVADLEHAVEDALPLHLEDQINEFDARMAGK